MRYRLLLPSLLTIGALGLTACRDDITEPNPPAVQVPTTATAVTANTWIKRADMWGIERWNLALAAMTNAAGQSVVYAIGGRSHSGGALSRVMAYNVATNTWTVKTSLPRPLQRTNGAVSLNGKVYISGGCPAEACEYSGYSSALFMYDPATNKWTRKHDMPNIGYGGVTGVIGGRLYVLTTCVVGFEGAFYECELISGDKRSRFFRYNPVTDSWATLPRPSNNYNLGAGGFISGKFYAAVGNHLEVYDPATNRWTTKAGGSVPYGAASAGVGGKLYVMGGIDFGADTLRGLRTTKVYNPTTNAWTNKALLPSPRYGVAAKMVSVNGQQRIELVGGTLAGNNLQYIP